MTIQTRFSTGMLLMAGMTGPAAGQAVLAQATPVTARASVASMHAPLVAAHRGGFFGGQGNLPRILRTLADGDADIVEIDLRKTRDGRVVIYHDGDLARRTDCSGPVEAHTFDSLSTCHLHGSQASPPLFSDVLAAASGRAIMDVEFKTAAAIEPAIDIVNAAGALDRVYFQLGSDCQRYARVRAYSPEANLQFKVLTDNDLDWALGREDPHLIIIEMDRDLLDAGRITRAHRAGKLVSANSWRYQFTEERFAASCARAFNNGVDIAVSNNAASCARQRGQPPYSALHEWVFSIAGRPNVRAVARDIERIVRLTLPGLDQERAVL